MGNVPCCARDGAWRLCPFCGAPWVAVPANERRQHITISDIARMRREGLTWKQIDAGYGYRYGNVSRAVADAAFDEAFEREHPRPPVDDRWRLTDDHPDAVVFDAWFGEWARQTRARGAFDRWLRGYPHSGPYFQRRTEIPHG